MSVHAFFCFQQFPQFRYFSLSGKYWLYKVKHTVLFELPPVFHEQLKYHNDMTFYKKQPSYTLISTA